LRLSRGINIFIVKIQKIIYANILIKQLISDYQIMDKKKVKEAMVSFEKFSNAQLKILSILIDLSMENEVSISAKTLISLTKFGVPTVYNALKVLQQNEIISKDFNAANTYQFNIKKINQILELYEQKKKIVIEEACAKSTTVK
jgi:Fe2+ or Zn2+ uptake regulation protein